MSLKEATANSLLMFVAATCVVLIVKAVSPPPQVLQAVARSSSGDGTVVGQNPGTPSAVMRNGVKVYYLHGNTRCPTCRTIEAYAQEAVQSGFTEELKNGQLEWQVVNYESAGNEHYATDYEVIAPNVVLVKLADGKQVNWKGLPEVWEHVSDKPAFVSFVQTQLRDFLAGSPSEPPSASSPESSSSQSPLLTLPIPE